MEMHSMPFEQMKMEVSNRIYAAKILGAATSIQRAFKKFKFRRDLWEIYIRKYNAAKLI
jgi:hypothetical protein